MRAMLGITIAVPVAIVFCLSYLLMLGVETGRDAIHFRRRARHQPLAREPWDGLIGKAA